MRTLNTPMYSQKTIWTHCGNLATDKNQLIALAALHKLLEKSKTDQQHEQLLSLIPSLPKYCQAVMVFWLMQPNNEQSQKDIVEVIKRAKNTSELSGVALGVESWISTQGRSPFLGVTRDLQLKIINKWRSFDETVPDDYKGWFLILNAEGQQ